MTPRVTPSASLRLRSTSGGAVGKQIASAGRMSSQNCTSRLRIATSKAAMIAQRQVFGRRRLDARRRHAGRLAGGERMGNDA